jgi:catalase
MTADQRQRLFANIAESMNGVPLTIIFRQLAHFAKADAAYAAGVAKALRLEM